MNIFKIDFLCLLDKIDCQILFGISVDFPRNPLIIYYGLCGQSYGSDRIEVNQNS